MLWTMIAPALLTVPVRTATNNPYFAADTTTDPEADATDPADYIGVASVIYPQTAAPVMLSTVKAIKTGRNPANREASCGS
jgi:hypothetical protein